MNRHYLLLNTIQYKSEISKTNFALCSFDYADLRIYSCMLTKDLYKINGKSPN